MLIRNRPLNTFLVFTNEHLPARQGCSQIILPTTNFLKLKFFITGISPGLPTASKSKDEHNPSRVPKLGNNAMFCTPLRQTQLETNLSPCRAATFRPTVPTAPPSTPNTPNIQGPMHYHRPPPATTTKEQLTACSSTTREAEGTSQGTPDK